MKNIILYLAAIILGTSNAANSQTKSQNNDIWLHYVGKNMISKKTSLTLETTMRFANGFREKQQYFIRPSIDYQFTKMFVGSLGFTHYSTFVYGSPALNKRPIPENHIWLQGSFTNQIGNLKLTNRLRDENRWVGIATAPAGTTEYSITDYKYRNRFRYMITATYPLIKKNDKPLLNGIIGDEAFINVGKNAGATLFNQNRVIVGLGYVINKYSQVQLSYIHQNIWNFTDTIEESNPTLRISYLTNLRLNKK